MTSGQRPAPAHFLDLKDLLLELHRIRIIPTHHPLMLDRKYPVQIATSRRQERRPSLGCRYRKPPVEFGPLVLPRKTIRFLYRPGSCHPQLLRQALLIGFANGCIISFSESFGK
jgi:hypothetical protein